MTAEEFDRYNEPTWIGAIEDKIGADETPARLRAAFISGGCASPLAIWWITKEIQFPGQALAALACIAGLGSIILALSVWRPTRPNWHSRTVGFAADAAILAALEGGRREELSRHVEWLQGLSAKGMLTSDSAVKLAVFSKALSELNFRTQQRPQPTQ